MNGATFTVWIWVPTLLLVAARLGGIFLVAPVLSHAAVPLKVKIPSVLVISLAVAARMTRPVVMPASAAELLLAAGPELLIGATIGFAARLIFMGVQLGAFHIGQQMGLSLAEVFAIDPLSEEQAGGVQSVFAIFALAIFLLIGGHRAMIAGLLRSFDLLGLPPASAASGQTMLGVVVAVLASSFVLALKVAGPVLVTLLLATVAMELLQRTLPQAHIFSTHMPIRVLVGLTAMAVSIAVIQPLLTAAVEYFTNQIGSIAGVSS